MGKREPKTPRAQEPLGLELTIHVQRLAICSDEYVNEGKCDSKQIGEFIVSSNATEQAKNPIVSKAIHLKDPDSINYPIKKTGYYCIVTDPWVAEEYTAVVEFRNAYGELPATQIPKLPFYGAMTIVYTLMAVYWGFLYYQHRHDIRESLRTETKVPAANFE